MNSNPFFFWVYGKCQGLVRQHILYGSINLVWCLKFKLRSKLGADGSTQRLWMAMQISLASFIHAKVGAFNHCITSHYTCVMSFDFESVNFAGSSPLAAVTGVQKVHILQWREDSWWDLTQKETCRWLQWQAVFGIYAPGQLSLHWFNIMYIGLIICYVYIYTHRYISSTKPKWVLVSKMAFAAPGCAAWLSGWACFVSWWAKEDPAVCQVHLSQAEEAEPLAWDSFSAGLCFLLIRHKACSIL